MSQNEGPTAFWLMTNSHPRYCTTLPRTWNRRPCEYWWLGGASAWPGDVGPACSNDPSSPGKAKSIISNDPPACHAVINAAAEGNNCNPYDTWMTCNCSP